MVGWATTTCESGPVRANPSPDLWVNTGPYHTHIDWQQQEQGMSAVIDITSAIVESSQASSGGMRLAITGNRSF